MMNIRKTKLFTLALFILLAGAACSQKDETAEIREVSAGYLKALVDYRLDDAKKFGDGSTAQFLKDQQDIIDSWTDEQREEARKTLANTQVTIASVDINEDKATVKYEFIQDGNILQSELLYLVKNSAGWQVHESME